MITASNITIQFGPKPLFENISAKFGQGMRVGLIGANGSGKSTLLKILGGDLAASSGNVSVDQHTRVGKLRQDQFAFEEFSVVDTVIMGHSKLWKIKKERDRIYGLPEMSEDEAMKVAELEVEFAELDGYTAESRASELLLSLEIPLEQHTGLMSEIAPGWKLRVLLAQALFANPDIMLLDEPTNNLDINTIRWLEDTLNRRNSTMIIVSHDRHFLNSVCTHMADLDYGTLHVYPGTYDDYMLASTQKREGLLSDNAKKEKQIAELQSFVSRFSANASKAKQATSRMRQMEKIELEDVIVSSRVNPFIRFSQEKQLYRNALVVRGLSKGFDGETLFNNVKLTVEVGERVAILGTNGIGKTTLLRTLIGELEPDEGTVKWSENSKISYVPQDHENIFKEDINLFDWMSRYAKPGEDEQVIRGTLGRLLFSQHEIKKKVNVLSGGEEGRMLFGKVMQQKPNIIIMDEPTNHLDMEAIESLNLALENYPGTLFFVSHDREFVSSIATRILVISDKGIEDYHGTYEEYLRTI